MKTGGKSIRLVVLYTVVIVIKDKNNKKECEKDSGPLRKQRALC